MYDNFEFVICCAGECTRNYPHSKAISHKSLLPLGDKRMIDYVLHDIVQMGARHVTIVCSNQKVVDDFKKALQTDKTVEEKLRKKGKKDIANVLASTFLPDDMDLKFAIQDTPLGTGHVIYVARDAIQDRHVVLIFPDDVILSKDPKHSHIQKLVDAFTQNPKNILLTGLWREDVSNNAILVNNRIIEKPQNPTSHIAGYSPIVLPHDAIQFLIQQGETKVSEAQSNHTEWLYMDTMNDFLDQGGEAAGFGVEMFLKSDDDILLDTGTLPLYEQCQLYVLLKHSQYQDQHKQFIKELLK